MSTETETNTLPTEQGAAERADVSSAAETSAATKPRRRPREAAEPVEQPMPAEGGIYIRQPDGGLECVEGPALATDKEGETEA